MLNQVFKLGLFVTLGIWLRYRARGLFALAAVLAVTWVLHSEYLGYVSRSGDDNFLALSYAIKWGVFILAAGCYYVLVERRIRARPELDRNTISHPDRATDRDDGFDFLRHKKTLESEADKALNNPKRGAEG